MPTVDVVQHGPRVSARVGGTQGPVPLVLHGLLGSAASVGPALDPLARTHRVVAPDLVGHAASEEPSGDDGLGAVTTQARGLPVLLGRWEVVPGAGHVPQVDDPGRSAGDRRWAGRTSP